MSNNNMINNPINNMINNPINNMIQNMIVPCILSAAAMIFVPAQFGSNDPVKASEIIPTPIRSFGSAVPTASINRPSLSFGAALAETSQFDYNQAGPFIHTEKVNGLSELISNVIKTPELDVTTFSACWVLHLVAIALGLLTFFVLHWQDLQSFNTQTIEMPLINIKEESILVEEEKIETTSEEKTSNVVITRKRDSGCFINATDNVKTVSTDAPLQTIQVDENELNSCISQQNQSIESLLESVQVDENELNSCTSQQNQSTETLESMQAEMDELDRQIWESMQAEMAELDRIISESKQAEESYQAELDALDIRDAQRESLYSKQKLSIETLLEQAEQEIPQDVEITKPIDKSLEEVVNTCISEQFGLSIKTLLDDAEYEAYISEAINAFAKQLDISTSTQNTSTRTLLEDAALEAFHITLQSKQTKLWTMSSKHCSPVEALTPSTFFSQLFQ